MFTSQLRLRGFALAAAAALSLGSAEAQTADSSSPVYYKGKGVGGDNSYVNRYEEDFSFLRDPSKSTDLFDPLKFIPFDDAKQIYLTLSALERLRYDNIQNNTYNLGNQVNGHQAEAYERRTEVGADLHLGPHFRLYAELLNAAASGRNLNGVGRVGGTGPGTSWRNDLALQQGFVEAMSPIDLFGAAGVIGIRAGRQGVYLGNGLAFSFNPTPNIFVHPDGLRLYVDAGRDRLDVFFGVPPIRRNDGLLRDGDDAHSQFGVIYWSHDFPTIKLLGADAHVSDDPFLIHIHNASGGTTNPLIPPPGAPFRTITTTYGNGAGAITTINGAEEVYTIGDRLFGDVGNFDFDWIGQLQRGSFGGYSVEAFAVYTDWGYTFRDVAWKPRVGTHADVASGGGDKASRTTHLFDSQFIRQPYIGETINTAPTLSNLYDLAPRVRISPSSKITAEFSWVFLWRYSSADGVYGPGGPYNGPSTIGGAATVGKPGTYIGSQPQLDVRWAPIAHVTFDAAVGQMVAGPVIKNAGGKNDTYFFAQVTLQF